MSFGHFEADISHPEQPGPEELSHENIFGTVHPPALIQRENLVGGAGTRIVLLSVCSSCVRWTLFCLFLGLMASGVYCLSLGIFCTIPSAWQTKLPSLHSDFVPDPNDNLIPFLYPATESVSSVPALHGAECKRSESTPGGMRAALRIRTPVCCYKAVKANGSPGSARAACAVSV